MPRDGADIYHRPPGIDAVTNTTISSTAYNLNVQDVEVDLNHPRPIVAGGTGASSALQALQNLGGEMAKQVVTNYDATVWQPGSFYSSITATDPPIAGHAFAGVAFAANASGDFALEATDLTDTNHNLYSRVQSAGVWGPWTLLNSTVVNNAFSITNTTSGGSPTFILNKNDGTGGNNTILGETAGKARWAVVVGDSTPETGGNTGSNFDIFRYADDGTLIDATLQTNRATGTTTVKALTAGPINSGAITATNISATGSIATGAGGATGTYYFGNSGTQYITYDGTKFVLNGAPFTINNAATINGATTINGAAQVNGDVTASRSSPAGAYFFGNTGTSYLYYDGAKFNFSGGDVTTGANVICADVYVRNSSQASVFLQDTGGNPKGALLWTPTDNSIRLYSAFPPGGVQYITYLPSGIVQLGAGMQTKPGTSGIYSNNAFNIFWTGTSTAHLWIDNIDIGQLSVVSDYRIKKDVINLPGMWETVKSLRPIKYTQADFAPLFEADNIERWGFIAHELQEQLIPSAATGVKDAPDAVQSPNPWTVIAALTKALQEAMTRIEALEAK